MALSIILGKKTEIVYQGVSLSHIEILQYFLGNKKKILKISLSHNLFT